MSNIGIITLGGFHIIVDGKDIISSLSGSKKKILLLECLILKCGSDIDSGELINILWPGDANTNPSNSLKTLVSRMRVELEALGLNNAILTRRGGYAWNPHLADGIDIFEFEQLCEQLKDCDSLAGNEPLFEQALKLYNGELLPDAAQEMWISTRGTKVHNKFIALAHDYVRLLAKAERPVDAVAAARRALEFDPYEPRLNLLLMSFLLKLGENEQALSQYNFVTGTRPASGRDLPADIRGFYKLILRNEQLASGDIEQLRDELLSLEKNDNSAFVCDISVFREMFCLISGTLRRYRLPIYLVLCSIECDGEQVDDPLKIERLMESLLRALRDNLRHSDVIARRDSTKYALLMPAQSISACRSALQRVKKALYSQYALPGYSISFQITAMQE